MKHKEIFSVVLFLPVVFFAGTIRAQSDVDVTVGTKKSSVIPVRREFPVNKSIDPCLNFYEYACSCVKENFELREDSSRHTFSYGDTSKRLFKFKKEYFFSLAKKHPETEMEGEIKNYYLACMNEEAKKEEELELVRQTKEMLDQIETKEELLGMIAANITNYSGLSFVSFSTTLSNLDNPNYNDLFFNIPLMSLPGKSYYENDETVEDLKDLIKDFFVVISEEDSLRKAKLVLDFEIELAQVYPGPLEISRQIFSRTEISREKLTNDYPNLKLGEFIKKVPSHVVVRDIIGNGVMEFLDRKLDKVSLEDLKSIFLYFQLEPKVDDAYPKFSNKRFEFIKNHLGGSNKRLNRQERCVKDITSFFGKEVDFILLLKIFPVFPKEKFIKLAEKIRTSFLDQIEENTWLTKGAKQEAIRKIKMVRLRVASPNNEEEWDFNPGASYSIDAPIANMFKLKQLVIDKKIDSLKGPINTDRWTRGPLSVNSWIKPSYNSVTFPIGKLQYPFYDQNEPEEINFGAIGSIIGHEFSHVIDHYGGGYDADGIFRKWLTDADKKIFDDKSKPLIEQFDKIGHNGTFTLAENIGDLVGLTTAYRATFPVENKHTQEQKQNFFLQYARMWCSLEREGVSKKRLKTDPHSLEYARCNEQIKNQDDFKEAYNCKATDFMVIPEKDIVKIW